MMPNFRKSQQNGVNRYVDIAFCNQKAQRLSLARRVSGPGRMRSVIHDAL